MEMCLYNYAMPYHAAVRSLYLQHPSPPLEQHHRMPMIHLVVMLPGSIPHVRASKSIALMAVKVTPLAQAPRQLLPQPRSGKDGPPRQPARQRLKSSCA